MIATRAGRKLRLGSHTLPKLSAFCTQRPSQSSRNTKGEQQPYRKPSGWSSRITDPIQKAAAVATEFQNCKSVLSKQDEALDAPQVNRRKETGAFQKLLNVPSAEEHITSALRRAARIPGNKAIKNKAQHARNLAARRLDALTQGIATPLGTIIKCFPRCGQLHPFERALLDLTLGIESYETRLWRLNELRKSCLEVGKSFAGQASKAANMKDAFRILEEGFNSIEVLYRKNAAAVDAVKDAARLLRKLPVVNPATPTLALVGAPNVGKSSLVQILSSGLPEICDYPFTTRTVKMGHFFVDGARYQVTDTPGLLNRKDEVRNAMERLTLACLQYLPTSVLFVADLTGQCGTTPADQWAIRSALKADFPDKPWLDVFSKADLLGDVFWEADAEGEPCAEKEADDLRADDEEEGDCSEREGKRPREMTPAAVARFLPQALRISSVEETGIDGLKMSVLLMMSSRRMPQESGGT